MVGGCVVELNFTTNIMCQVSAVSKILSMQSTEFCLCRLRTNLVQNFLRTAFWSEKSAPKKVMISSIFIKRRFTQKR